MKNELTKNEVFPGLWRVTLHRGAHVSRDMLNAMEATAWLAGEPHTNAPVSVAPSFRWLVALLNEQAPDAPRQGLKEALPYLIGTSTYGNEERRIEMIAQWAKQWGLQLEGEPTQLQETANRLQQSAGQAEAKAVRTAGRADDAAARLGIDSVAAHAAAYEDAGLTHARSGKVRDAALIAASAMEEGIRIHGLADREAATAAADAADARSDARHATESAREQQETWWIIVNEAVALIRQLSQEESAEGQLRTSQHQCH